MTMDDAHLLARFLTDLGYADVLRTDGAFLFSEEEWHAICGHAGVVLSSSLIMDTMRVLAADT